MPQKKQTFPPELKIRLTPEWLTEHTNIFTDDGEHPFSVHTAFRIKKRFERYWKTWIEADLEALIGNAKEAPIEPKASK